ncbi:Asp23/Gls24 family envelope stress response protein [Arthrobacter sp. H14-L1]|uniref:Asp23/Gls24 family envelope stress response protein n=1 Tax=Arthrobacter sp. H14-L1 TaxID=2996697 RepID=UPI00226D45F7|nr:Asp23/Gls24 family envelope stress response protein [Arthrobacter sp. H14-L1]MCY0904100.1 Asp23/Gls24 family envelope stress response protein [Arthrobacter sp. H14-L1]
MAGSIQPPIAAVRSGRTVISESAVAKVAGLAARTVPGVRTLGSGSGRSLGTAGVHAEVGATQTAVDVKLVAEYGTELQQMADGVRAAVYVAVENLVGLSVSEVNVEVTDVHLPDSAPEKLLGRSRHSAFAERAAAAYRPAENGGQL